jgi:hypothetical protein
MEEEFLCRIKECRLGLYLNRKILCEEGDSRYPQSFIDGIMVGLQQAINAIDTTIELYSKISKDER